LKESLYLTGDKKPRFFYGYIIVFAAFLIMAFTWGTVYSYGVFFKPLSAEFGWTRAATSGAYSLVFLLHGFLGIFAGRLSDRFGPRIVITTCGLFLASGYLLMSQVSAIWQLYLFYGIVGIGSSGAYVPSISAVTRWFVKRRGLMTGISTAGAGLGVLIMPPIANWLISSYGWRTSYVAIGVIVIASIVVSAQFMKRDPRQIGQLPYGEGEVSREGLSLEVGGFSLKEAIYTKQFWMLGIMFLCFGFSLQSILVHIVPYTTDLAISSANAVTILAIIGGCSLASRVILGSVADRIGNKQAVTVCFSMMFVSLLWLLFARDLWMFNLFAVIFGLAYGGWAALVSLIVAETFGLASLGVILGSVTLLETIGHAVGPVLTGWTFDFTGGYQPAFSVCVAISMISIILALLLRPIADVRTAGNIDRNSGKE